MGIIGNRIFGPNFRIGPNFLKNRGRSFKKFIRTTRIIELMEPPEEAVGLGQAEDDAGNQDEDRAEPEE